MADIVLGCDTNDSDSTYQNTVAKGLRDAGHNVEQLSIGPNFFASYSYGENGEHPQGKIGIYLMADSSYSVADLAFGGTSFKYAYFGIRGDLGLPRMSTWDDFRNNPIGKDPDCKAICDKVAGKTYPQMNEICKDKCQITFGRNAEEMVKSLLNVMSGQGITDDTGDNVTGVDEKGQEAKGGTIKEALQKLLKHWDGEVECYIRGDKVYVHKVRDPATYTSLLLEEGTNVLRGSISIKDINPDTTNYLTVNWSGGTIEVKDHSLIDRFGEKPETVEAVKIVTSQSQEYEENRANAEAENLESRGITSAEMYSDEDGELVTDNSTGATGTDATGTDTTGTGTGTDATGTGEEEGNTKKKKSKVQSIPIDNYDDALTFATTYWNKIRRDDGHSIDCQVIGASQWKVGEWCRVKLPSFNEDCYMYVTRASHSGDGDWTTSLTLQDYPPGWGVEETEESASNDENPADDTGTSNYSSEKINKIVQEIGKFSYESGCSDAECIKATGRGECWALSDYVYKRLTEEGISAHIYEYATSSASNHRQVKYNDGKNWVMFPYGDSGIDHFFYTNEIPDDANEIK